jgi:hypothetical protein
MLMHMGHALPAALTVAAHRGGQTVQEFYSHPKATHKISNNLTRIAKLDI